MRASHLSVNDKDFNRNFYLFTCVHNSLEAISSAVDLIDGSYAVKFGFKRFGY